MKLKLFAAALAATLTTASVAHSACTQADVSNKSWKISAYEVTLKALIFCKFHTGANGAIKSSAGGCEGIKIEAGANFNSPTRMSVQSGSITMIAGDSCTFNATMSILGLNAPLSARLVMESGKTIASGGFLLANGGGTISMMLQ